MWPRPFLGGALHQKILTKSCQLHLKIRPSVCTYYPLVEGPDTWQPLQVHRLHMHHHTTIPSHALHYLTLQRYHTIPTPTIRHNGINYCRHYFTCHSSKFIVYFWPLHLFYCLINLIKFMSITINVPLWKSNDKQKNKLTGNSLTLWSVHCEPNWAFLKLRFLFPAEVKDLC